MKDIPVFTAASGVATLILKEISWSGSAYVLIRSVWDGRVEELLEECRRFCTAVGAKAVYASWDAPLPAAHAYDMIRMERQKAGLPEPGKAVQLEAVRKQNGSAYLEIYHQCFRMVPAAASYGKEDLRRLEEEETGWLAVVDGVYAAVAEISASGLEGVGVRPEFAGLGYDLLLTVLPMIPAVRLQLKVADTNTRAIRLYQRLGFRETTVERSWWRLESP